MKKVSQLSVFFPAFNEEENIERTVLEAKKVLAKIAQAWEIIVVDDGSKDKTGLIIQKICQNDPRIKLITHPTNKGYGAAIKTGLYSSKYSLICSTDSDGQFQFAEIEKFLDKIDQADLVIGYRIKRTDRLYRRVLASILRIVNLILFGINVKDVDCGFKLLKKSVIKGVGKLVTESAITVTELIVRAKRKGFKIFEVGVNHYSRIEGEQTGGKLKIVWKAGIEGLKLWWDLFNENKN